MRYASILLASLCAATALFAQSLPRGVSFTASPDHASTALSGYKIYLLQGTTALRVRDIGKPQADASGSIIHMDAELFSGLAPGTYDIGATAYGPAGESPITSTASFSVSTTISAPVPPSGIRPIYDDVPAVSLVVQAEDFDQGGQWIGYLDFSPGNAGSTYRDSDVDLEPTSDAGAGHNLGWTSAGEWLKYTVNVPAAGTYAVEIRVAAPDTGGMFHIEIDGVDRTGPLMVPNTGGWQVWTTVRREGVQLQAGTQTWRLILDTENPNIGSVGNFNWIRASLQ